ncbi:hypothetical protein, partial [Methyloglobulus morosus]|uniref:hypothetical protein n=1 Tax=Methyloglobulus morosus TaxID=1410681 RepID=UPI0005654765
VADKVKNQIHLPWVVSYDHAPEIVKLYNDCRSIEYGINYSAQEKYKGAEVMFFSEKIKIPAVINPVDLRTAV